MAIKINFFIILAIIAGFIFPEVNAISYEGFATEKKPFFYLSGTTTKINSIYDYNHPSGSCASPYSCNISSYGGNAEFSRYIDGYITDSYFTNKMYIYELDFGISPLFGGSQSGYVLYESYNTVDTYHTVWVLKDRNTIEFQIYYIVSGAPSYLYRHQFNLTTPFDAYGTGTFYPERVAYIIEETYYSTNTLAGGKSYLRAGAITLINSQGRLAEFVLEPFLLISNTFQNHGGTQVGVWGLGAPSSYYDIQGYSRPGSYRVFPVYGNTNNHYEIFGELEFGDTLWVSNSLSEFYTSDIITSINSSVIGETTGGGSGTGFTSGWYSECGGFTDVLCYVTNTFDGFKDKFFPSLVFDGTFDSCNYEAIEATGGYMQKFANIITLVNPFPPGSGSTICILPFIGGGTGTMQYQRIFPDENWFEHYVPTASPLLTNMEIKYFGQTPLDIFVIVSISILLFYRKGHD